MNALIAGRVGQDQAVPVPGSRVGECSQCHQAVWLAPSAQDPITEGYQVVCMTCAEPLIKNDPEATILPPTAKQLKEIANYFGGQP